MFPGVPPIVAPLDIDLGSYRCRPSWPRKRVCRDAFSPRPSLVALPTTWSCRFSASWYRPWEQYVQASLSMEVIVPRCSPPKQCLLVSTSWSRGSSDSSCRPCFPMAITKFAMVDKVDGSSAPKSFFIMNRTGDATLSTCAHLPCRSRIDGSREKLTRRPYRLSAICQMRFGDGRRSHAW